MTWYSTPKAEEEKGDQQEEDQEQEKQEEEEKVEDINAILKELQAEMNETNPEKAKEMVDALKKTYNVKDVVQQKKLNLKTFSEDD